MDTSEPSSSKRDVSQILRAGYQSKTWDILGMPHFVTTTHREGCGTCEAYALHVVEASRAPMVEIPLVDVETAFRNAWPNIVRHIEDGASSEAEKRLEWYNDRHEDLTDDLRKAEEKFSSEKDRRRKADEKLAQANEKIKELEAKLVSLQTEVHVLQKQDKRTPIDRGDAFECSDSESEATSGKKRKRQNFPPAMQYGGFFPDDAGSSLPLDDPMPETPAFVVEASSALAPSQPPPLTSRMAPQWGKGDPPMSITGKLPRPLGKTRAGLSKWQHTCEVNSPEFQDALLVARAKKGSERTPEEHTILSRALKQEKARARALKPAAFIIPPGIASELTSMMQTWLMNEAACPPAVRQESDNTLNLRDVDFWLWHRKVTPKGMAREFKSRFWEIFSLPGMYDIMTDHHYKSPNSSDGCMRLRARTACPEWVEGNEADEKILRWLSTHAGLTSECVTEVIEPFAKRRSENLTHGTTWNEAAKRAASRKTAQLPSRAILTALPGSAVTPKPIGQDSTSDTVTEPQLLKLDDDMVIDEPAKPVAGPSTHPDEPEFIADGDLMY